MKRYTSRSLRNATPKVPPTFGTALNGAIYE
jgi:hypothetical protein